MKRILLILVVSLLMWSCSAKEITGVKLNDLGKLSKGDSYKEIVQQNKFDNSLLSEWKLEKQNGNSEYKVAIYKASMSGQYVFNFKILVFKDESLFCWGFIEDFLKNDSIEINKIGEEIAEILPQLKKGF